MELRPYQQEVVAQLREVFRAGHRSALMVMPTGAGKTRTFASIAQGLTMRGARVCVIVHRRELLLQACRALTDCGLHPQMIVSERRGSAPSKVCESQSAAQSVCVAMAQTLVNRLQNAELQFDWLIIDEAHHAAAGTWVKLMEHYQAHVIGVTATPIRTDGRGLGKWFERMVLGPTPAWLTEQGYLARARVFAPPIGFKPEQCRTVAGDYCVGDVVMQLDAPDVIGDVVEHYRKHLDGQTAIAFCASVEHAIHTAERFQAAGIAAVHVSGQNDQAERDAALEGLATGEVKIVTSCQLIGEGVDVPSVAGCILLRPTKSLALFLQMVGRCLRPDGEKQAIVLDHCGNYERHGHHLQHRDWSLETGVTKQAKPKARALWDCPVCFAVNDSSTRTCRECGHVSQRKAVLLSEAEGELHELSDRQLLFLERKAERDRKAKAKHEQGQARTIHQLTDLALSRGYKNPRGWAIAVHNARRLKRTY